VGLRSLRWFDGTVVRETVDAPEEIANAVAAPGDGLWAATMDGAVLHWDGSSWSTIDPAGPHADGVVTALAVDAAGRPWIGWLQDVQDPESPVSPYSGWVSRYDGSSWTTFDANDAPALAGGVSTILQLPDGDVWVATSTGLVRFDGSTWTDAGWPSGSTAAMAAGPDGTIWAASGDTRDGAVTVKRLDGRAWVSYGPADGLPGPLESGFTTAWPLPTANGVFVGTGAGIYELTGDRWQRAWPKDRPPAMDPVNVLAVSRDELWAIGRESGAWHFQGAAWTREPVDPDRPESVVRAIAIAPDGTPWAVGPDGVALWRDGAWTIVDADEASIVTVGRDGTVWIGSVSDETCRVSNLQFDGTAWVSRAAAGCPPESSGLSSLAVDANGALWAVWTGRAPGCGWDGCPRTGLARLHGSGWEVTRELAGIEVTTLTLLGTSPTGDIWVVADPSAVLTGSGEPNPIRAASFDGADWTVVELPDRDSFMSGIALAPDGALWASGWWVAGPAGGDRGPARYDGTAWTFPYASAGLPWTRLAAVAPDGTVFGEVNGSLFRLPDRVSP
jgi:hypothetical protein